MTRQPHKQRNRQERAALHEKQKQVRAPLSPELREEYGQRNVRVNAGDTVEVQRGDFAGESGEVVTVDLRAAEIHVEDVTQETADGEEVPRPLEASNVQVTELDLEDEVREARLESEEDNE
ncbi:50S ribosomal protein L24 [Natronomonas pharaonis DSM 2160]|uniref:Large ribosomal subunit protein uL24 n=1 Tax=Natronomonas pharaonis (strain ATCC 35678 / DSM 2160 / CIP 103997 / JCM 8858 / NBRC 14720 / NCIMB 2260 / Gabara) TaxID=348780 RepID=RL24_NATPD|nr:50S ribosomal protein L24 [Natronomonas pharaonis]Q3IMX7.1 RecName: Full=Large ribosomal subunit protein uL24; AltName: Full=50S ribosomal protein L24 [Natronomonas pharaonis DSM 2160]CAI50529.1 50S ribosomal protein L24 [Natronomonas pharaonis DSM 2160]